MTREQRIPPGKYRLLVEDYGRLVEAGAFAGCRTELIEGDVIVMSPRFRPHGMAKMRLYEALRDALRGVCSSLCPVMEFSLALSRDSMPEPDIMLTTEPDGTGAVPLASVALIVEVSDATLADDLGVKQQLYAGAGVPEYWVADVAGRVIHQMWGPGEADYAQRRETAFGTRIAAMTVPGLEVGTGAL